MEGSQVFELRHRKDYVKQEEEELEVEEEEKQGEVKMEKKKGAGAGAGEGEGVVLDASPGSPPVGVFAFWAYLVGVVSVLTLVLVALFHGSGGGDASATEIFGMPDAVRQHLSKGALIKVEIGPEQQQNPLNLFVRDEGNLNGDPVLLLHGLGSSSFLYRDLIPLLTVQGFRVVSPDLPGSGLSQKLIQTQIEVDLPPSPLAKLRDILDEISEKGLFWRFEHMFEAGHFPEVHTIPTAKPRLELVNHPVSLSPQELGQTIGQILDSLSIPSAHIVLHDSAIESGLSWASQNPSRIASITFLDAYPHHPSLPLRLLGVPGLGFLVVRAPWIFRFLLRACCARTLPRDSGEAHAYLLKHGNGQIVAVEMWRRSNLSFDLSAAAKKLEQVPLHVLWAGGWSQDWFAMGKMLQTQLLHASIAFHNGSRWPQEDAATEIAQKLGQYILSIPRNLDSLKKSVTESEGSKRTFAESHSGESHASHDHNHWHGLHDHHHEADTAFMDGMGHGGGGWGL